MPVPGARRIVVLLAVLSLAAAPVAGAASPRPAPGPVIDVAGAPRAGVFVDGMLWVLVEARGLRRAIEIDPVARRPTGRGVLVGSSAPILRDFPWNDPPPPLFVAIRGGLWTVDGGGTAVRIDPRLARATIRVPLPGLGDGRGWALGAGAGQLWMYQDKVLVDGGTGRGFEHRLARLDPDTGAVIATAAFGPGLGGQQPDGIAVGISRMWLSFVKSVGHRGLEISLTGGPALEMRGGRRMTTAAGLLYAMAYGRCDVYVRSGAGRPAGARLATLPPPRCDPAGPRRLTGQDLVAGPGGSLWVVFRRDGGRGVLVRRSLSGAPRLEAVAIGRDPVDLVPAPGAVWLIDAGSGRLTRYAARR